MNAIAEAEKSMKQAQRYIEYVRDRHPEIHEYALIWSRSSDGKVDPYAGHEPERNNNYRGD